MGRPKALLPVRGRALLLHHIDGFLRAGLPVSVVVGGHSHEILAALDGVDVHVVLNPRWRETGMADSLRLAQASILASGAPAAAIITPVDAPPGAPATLSALLAATDDAVPTFRGAPGHPVRLAGPLTATERLDHRLRDAQRIPVDDPDCLLNLNTPEEWAGWVGTRE